MPASFLPVPSQRTMLFGSGVGVGVAFFVPDSFTTVPVPGPPTDSRRDGDSRNFGQTALKSFCDSGNSSL